MTSTNGRMAVATAVTSMVVSLTAAGVAQLGLSPRIDANEKQLATIARAAVSLTERTGNIEVALAGLEGLSTRIERRFQRFAERAYKQGVRDARRQLGFER